MKQNECISNFVSKGFSEALPVFWKDTASRAKKKELAQFFHPRRQQSSIKIVQAERKKIFAKGFDRRTDNKLTGMKNLFFCSSV